MNASPEAQGLCLLLASFLLSAALIPGIIRLAVSRGWLDAPGERKVHRDPVPRLGGVAIFVATWLCWGVFAWQYPDIIPYEAGRSFIALFVASSLVWALGVYDDLVGANAYKKLAVQSVAATIVIVYGINIRILFNPIGGGDILIGDSGWVFLISFVWIIVVTNAINLIDGIDGLAGGVCLITALTLYFISRDLGIPHLPFFSLAVAGASGGFLIFNFSPARIFLGDSGSLFLGFTLACLSIMGTVKRSTAIVMFGPPLILALPVVDTLFAISRRFLKKLGNNDQTAMQALFHPRNLLIRFKEVFVADQEHIHHGLLKYGLSHRKAVIVLYLVTAVLGRLAYVTALQKHLLGTAIVGIVLSLGLWFLIRRSRHRVLSQSKEVD